MAFLKFKCKGKLPKPYGVLSQSISLLVLSESQLAASKAAGELEEVSIVEVTLKLALRPCTIVTREGCIASHLQQIVELLKFSKMHAYTYALAEAKPTHFISFKRDLTGVLRANISF